MLTQLKYSSRRNLNQRLLALGINTVINLGFLVLGMLGLLPEGWMITGVVFASLGLCALFIVNIIADFELIKSLFAAPDAYCVMLTPVPGWKIILSRVLSMTVLDIVTYAVGILGVILQAEVGWVTNNDVGFRIDDLASVLSGLIGYMQFLLLIIFACALAKSVLFHLKGRGLLGLASVIVLVYAGSWLTLLLAPFATVTRYHAFISVELVSGWNAGMIAFIVLQLIETAALLIASSYLYERKVNL